MASVSSTYARAFADVVFREEEFHAKYADHVELLTHSARHLKRLSFRSARYGRRTSDASDRAALLSRAPMVE